MVEAIDWGRWGDWKLCPNATGTRLSMYRYYENDVGVVHWLKEMGSTTNNYRYTVYYKGVALLDTYIKANCCGVYGRCPVGKQKLRAGPCRDAMRLSAIGEAHRHWLQFIEHLIAPHGGKI